MKRNKLIGVMGLGAGLVGATVLVASCGGGSDGDGSGGTPTGATAAQIDAASVQKMLPDISRVVPICTASAVTAKGLAKSLPASGWMAKLLAVRAGAMGPTAKALTGTPPADLFGSCGGKVTYLNYSHLTGVTRGTLAFQEYCTKDATGATTVVNGAIPFVNTATPTDAGPIFQKLEASSQGDLTTVQKDANGAALSTEKARFNNLVYTAGVPGGVPTAATPDTLTLGSVVLTNKDGKTYQQANYAVTQFVTATGGEQMSVTGTGYRSDGSSYTITSTEPLTLDSSGNWLAGKLTFTGANGANAVAVVVPGAELQATMTVNGEAVTSGVACK